MESRLFWDLAREITRNKLAVHEEMFTINHMLLINNKRTPHVPSSVVQSATMGCFDIISSITHLFFHQMIW